MIPIAILMVLCVAAILFLLLCLYKFIVDGNPQLVGYVVSVRRTHQRRGQVFEITPFEARQKPRPRRELRLMMAALLALAFTLTTARAQTAASSAPQASASDQQNAVSPLWQFGGFVDAAYLVDFNDPSNDLFRNRGTAYKVDEPILNMAAAYVQKNTSETSRWGLQFTVQAGQDSRVFGFSATAPNLPGSTGLRHLGPTNLSYLAPIGKGLTLQVGIFNSFIGYDSLYAKDNFNYTRPWGADFTPYLMMGINASYPFTPQLTGTLFVINGYWHLANANAVPSSGGQIAYKATPHVTLKETILTGPHQSDTSLEFWRFLSDSIAEWKTDRFTTAFEYQISSEEVAVAGNRAYWVSAQMPLHWTMNKQWSATVRPEFAWDSDGRWTGFEQHVAAVTTTVEYRIPYRRTNTIFRVEHRFDDSRGKGGGFFHDGEARTGVVGLTPSQHLLIFGLILSFDAPLHR
jgi:hypothetical protein